MAISEKTRKILWGRSANRCALCRHELVVDATDADNESVVGDECHIASGKVNGPRYNPTLPPERLDDIENLILLCRVHHKMVDDQRETYTVEVLRTLKANHEKWVSSRLLERPQVPPVRIRRIVENIPSHLVRLTTGQEIAAVMGDALGFSFEHDEPESEAEVELVAGFLQEAQGLGDLWSELEAGDRVKSTYRLGTLVRELEEAGFRVFGGREVQRLEGGVASASPFPVALLKVLRTNNPAVVRVGAEPRTANGDDRTAPKAPSS